MDDPRSTRLARLAAGLADLPGAPAAALVSRPANVRWLTGLVSSNAAVLVRADGGAVLATDGRYEGRARGLLADGLELVVDRRVADALLAVAAHGAPGAGAVAVETHHLTVDEHAELRAAHAGLRLTRLEGAVEALRAAKDEVELGLLRRACAATDAAFALVLPQLRPGRTELEVARLIDAALLDAGADAVGFETIVASGPNGAVPHHEPGRRPLERGDLVTMDFGAEVGGYHADMTRTVAVGEPDAWQRDVHALVLAAQQAGRSAVRAGVPARDVDAAARAVVEGAGLGPHFVHPLGHGVGLEIHEAPLLAARSGATIGAATPVTVEPGVYLPGRGGVRIEDVLVATPGAPELLTHAPRELLVL